MSTLTPARPRAGHKKRTQRRRLPLWAAALIVLGLVLGGLVGGLYKAQLTSWWNQLTGSDTREIAFTANRFLLEDASDVKVAGVDIGVVDSVVPGPDGGAIVTVVVDPEVADAVGDAPSARLRPTTLLSGLFYVELVPGGDRTAEWTEPIPMERTRLPVEVDAVAETLQPEALDGARAAVTSFDATLANGGTEALQELLANAPDTLGPAAGVIESVLGTRPDVDLSQLVTNLQASSSVLTRQDGQLDAIIATLQDTTNVFADTSVPVADAIRALPAALDTADAGLVRLDGSLDRLRDTAGPARESVQELDSLLETLEPVLADARPVVTDLRFALQDTRPLVEDLVPAADGLTASLEDLRGPVLDRLNGPIRDQVYAPYQGAGPFQYTTSGDNPLYEELGYMFSGLAKSGAWTDPDGHAVAFQPGPGTGTVPSFGGVSLEQMYQQLFHGAP